MNAPSKIWIAVAGKAAPEWVVEHMATGDIAADGSFDIQAADGIANVKPGNAVFEVAGRVYACAPKEVQAKLAAAVGADNEVVSDLADREAACRQAPLAKAGGDKPLRLKAAIGEPPAPQFAAVDRLLVDDTYQRSIEGGASQKLIVKIAENWDWRLCLPLLVSRRDGQLFVIDGQHRLEAARLRGDIQHMPVVIFDFDDPKAEADLFVQANRSRRQMSKLDDFHAAVVAGDPKMLAVNDVVTATGLQVGRIQAWQYWKPGEVVFVTAIQRALGSHGRPVVEAALSMIARAFQGLVLTGMGAVFEGLCSIIQQRAKAGTELDTGLMELVLAEVGVPGWKAAMEGADSGQDRADAMLKALNDAYAEAEGE